MDENLKTNNAVNFSDFQNTFITVLHKHYSIEKKLSDLIYFFHVQSFKKSNYALKIRKIKVALPLLRKTSLKNLFFTKVLIRLEKLIRAIKRFLSK